MAPVLLIETNIQNMELIADDRTRCDDYITKPIQNEFLIITLEKYFVKN